MANKKISELVPLNATPDANDILPLNDTSAGTTFSVKVSELQAATQSLASNLTDISTIAQAKGTMIASDGTNFVSLGAIDAIGLSAIRGDLGLGTAATTASTAYATSAQGTLADSAQQPPSEGAFVAGDKTKLDAVEAGADVTDATNVTAAGALMESEVTNLAEVKAFDSSDYATSSQGTLADSALQSLSAGALSDFNFDDNPILGFSASTNPQTNDYTLLASDNGKVIVMDKATAVTVTIDTGLPAGFNCSFIQKGAGQVTFAGTAAVNNRQSHTKINAQFGAASIVAYDTDTYILAGDTAS